MSRGKAEDRGFDNTVKNGKGRYWCRGRVVRTWREGMEARVKLDVLSRNQRGETTAQGIAVVRLPSRKSGVEKTKSRASSIRMKEKEMEKERLKKELDDMGLLVRKTVAVWDRFSPTDFWRRINSSGASYTLLLDVVMPWLMKRDPCEGDANNTLRRVHMQPLPEYHHKAVRHRFRECGVGGHGNRLCVRRADR